MECLHPIYLKKRDAFLLTSSTKVPCGKCVACIARKRSEWSFRLQQELKASAAACFVTLTYNDDNLIYTDTCATIVRRDAQLFLKRLRIMLANPHRMMQSYERYFGDSYISLWTKVSQIALNRPKIRYFGCGEYGSHTQRPHYHFILFGISKDFAGAIQIAWSINNKPIGGIHVMDVNMKAINYITKDMVMRSGKEDFRIKPFIMMSKKPGLGLGYVSKMKTYHMMTQTFYGIDNNGSKVNLPRYLKKKIFSDGELLAHRYRMAKKYLEEQREKDQSIISSGQDLGQHVTQTIDQTEKMIINRFKKMKGKL